MGNKPPKGRPSALLRHFSYMPPATNTNNFNIDSWPTRPPGLPVETPQWVERQKRRHLSWSGQPKQRPPSPFSTAATASDSQEVVSVDTGDFSSGSSSRYSGFNSSIYSPQIFNSLPSQIHALCDATFTPLVWDVRQEPKTLYTSHSASRFFGPNALSFPLTSTGAGHICILSHDFPWTIELGPKSRAITASEMLHALFDLLNKNLDDIVWGMADTRAKARTERAWKRRLDADADAKLKNVDWLGKCYMFKGLYRDDKFAQQRLQPGTTPVSETWLVSFAES
ncbi:hypothetical protein DFH11DRAFT_417682 [Phellopilus nigrolimitatus]|nr:hypothetical protein DFH11DRAFT_417682 [Phellopilus nigrolimitatus]